MAGSNRASQTGARRRAFLEAFKINGNVAEAARVAGVRRETPYKWLESSEAFRSEFGEAEQEAVDRVERIAHELATGFHERMIVSAGKVLGAEPIYSERMIEMILRARRPERYKDRREVEHSGEIRNVQSLLSDLPEPETG